MITVRVKVWDRVKTKISKTGFELWFQRQRQILIPIHVHNALVKPKPT
jgi:hypothetical protein